MSTSSNNITWVELAKLLLESPPLDQDHKASSITWEQD